MLSVISKQAATAKSLYRELGPLKVYLVDGKAVRHMPESADFTDFALHCNFPNLIPQNELWIDQTDSESQRFFNLEHGVREWREIHRGKSTEESEKNALRYERRLREQVQRIRYRPQDTDETAPREVYVKRLGQFPEEVEVWAVDGEFVRARYRTEFVLAGHGYVYHFIPNNEIWLDVTQGQDDWPATLLHEYVERTLMKYKGLSYNKAHDMATRAEFVLPDETPIDIVLRLSKDEALQMSVSTEVN